MIMQVKLSSLVKLDPNSKVIVPNQYLLNHVEEVQHMQLLRRDSF